MTRRLIVGSCLLAGLFGAAMCWSTESEPSIAQPGDTAPANVPVLATEPDESLVRTQAPASRGESAAASRFRRVLVVDEQHAPVRDADVAFIVSDEPTDANAPLFDPEVRFASSPRYRTGTDGMVELPTDAAKFFAFARARERFGQQHLDVAFAWAGIPTIAIAPECTLNVIVRGSDGTPRAGVPLVVLPESMPEHGFLPVRTVPSDRDGRVVLRHVQTLGVWDPAAPTLSLRADVLGAETESVRVAFDGSSTRNVDVPCPPFGSLLVRPVVSSTEPSVTAFVRDGALRAESILASAEVDGQRVWSKSVERIAGGEWRIGPVAIGQTWSVHALGHVEGSGPGPSRAFEEVVFDLAAAPPENLFVVRLQMPDGTPCADALVMQGVTRGDQRITLTRTDGDGLLRTSEPLWRRDCEAVEFASLPPSLADLATLGSTHGWRLDGPTTRLELGWRGKHLLVPCIVDGNEERPIVEASVVVEVSDAIDTVRATIHVNAGQVRTRK